MTLPNLYSTRYTGTSRDQLLCKAERDGANRSEPFQASVPSTTVVGQTVALVPFRIGARLCLNATDITFDALGTGVTASVGVIYVDNVNNTNNQTLFATNATTPAAGGFLSLVPSTTAGEQWASTGDGWIVVTLGGATTGTTGNVHGQIVITYDNY